MVERKDSGYGGSVSRSSSLAAFGRGIRKVFWKTSAKGSVESVVVTDTPVLDYGIPQDVLDHIDHETWAQDLAQRLTQASGPDAVTAWLGQLSAEGTEEGDLAVVEEVGNNNTTRSNNIGGVVIGTAVMSTPEGADSSETVLDVVEEVIFTMPMPILPTPPPSIQSAPDSTTVLVSKPLPAIRAATVPNPAADPAAKTLRQVLSIEQLNKPQPSIPVSPQIPISKPAVNQVSRSSASSTSPFNSITRRLTPDFGFRKNSGSRQTDQPHSEAANDSTTSLMTSPDEVEGSSYLSINPTSKRSNRFFKSLTSSTASDLKTATRHENEVRPLSEVLLSNSNLSPEEITAEIVTASRSSSLRSPPMRRAAFPVWSQQPSPEVSAVSTLGPSPLNQETQQQQELSPPAPLFYNKIRSSVSASSLGETSSCGSIDSADDWDNSLTQNMVNHSQAQNARYSADLKDLQALLFQTGDRAAAGSRPHSIMTHSTNTSTGSLILPGSVSVSATVSTSTSNRKDSTIAAIAAAAAMKTLSKKDDYMSHRLSGVVSPKLLPTTGAGKSKPRKSRLSMTFGGGELEVVKSAKFDTPEAIARNKEIRKFISQEIFTTEQNYLQYLHTVQEVFVDPLFKSLQTAKPFIPKSNALYHLLSHISGLIAVSAQLTQALEDCVRDEVWSEDSTLIGTIFLNVKEPLSIFLKYGQAYGKGMKALRTLLKAKRASVATMPQSPSPFFVPAITTTASNSSSVSSSNHLTVPGPRLTKRRSLPSIFSLNPSSAPSSSSMMAFAAASATSSNAGSHHHSRRLSTTSTNSTYSVSKPSSTHGSARVSTMPLQRTLSEFELFVQNCHGGKETTSRFSLADLLILPIQRVTRYCLLLKDLKRHTNSDHDDYVGLVHALEQLHTLAMATNNVQPASMRL
ncbi:Rho guanine nucleotide exchange factor (GEF) 17 [Gryganskiella cystojenkinii]|nr:Rho guanine nucleotide exchange factor (GEF) 17 [Gryganskiella cystojenkinii]